LHIVPFAKLVGCIKGRIFDVVVDLRDKLHPKWHGIELNQDNLKQLYVPANCAHGFMALTEEATIVYAQDGLYNPALESSVNWRDKKIGIEWPKANKYFLSEKDANAPFLDQI
jgi:dTDP-4-dehydrorhamnose 3,5-epimerase